MTTRTAAALLALALVATAATGCGRSPSGVAPEVTGWPQAVVEPTVPPQSSAEGTSGVANGTTATPAPSGTATATGKPRVKPSEISALEAELNAMERELQQDVLPSDSDFNDASGALY